MINKIGIESTKSFCYLQQSRKPIFVGFAVENDTTVLPQKVKCKSHKHTSEAETIRIHILTHIYCNEASFTFARVLTQTLIVKKGSWFCLLCVPGWSDSWSRCLSFQYDPGKGKKMKWLCVF